MKSGASAFSRLRSSPILLAGVLIVSFMLLTALFAPIISPYDPHALSGQSLEAPSAQHLLGTNNIGQDILSQLIWGARESLFVAIVGASLSVLFAVIIGVVPTLLGGFAEMVGGRLVDLLLAIPGFPLVLLIATLAGRSRTVLIMVIAIAGTPMMARVLTAQSKTLRQRGFISSARAFGGGSGYVTRRHLAPGLGPVIVTRFVDWAGIAVLLQAGLAFLGLADPTGISWGLMLNRAVSQQGLYFTSVWIWWVLPAGLAVTATILGLTLLGVGLEPVLNRRLGKLGSG